MPSIGCRGSGQAGGCLARSVAASGGTGTPGVEAGEVEARELALSEGRWEDARRSFEAALAAGETPRAFEGLARGFHVAQ